MAASKLILDYVFDHEVSKPEAVYLTQPLGGGQVADYTWRQTMDQARRMAAHIKAQGFAPGFRIAVLSKNCAHFIMAELAIWMAGGTTTAIFPTETADTVKYVLEHSGASMLFVGKLDTWDQQKPGVPAGLPCIAFPLAPKNDYDTWDKVIARTQPLTGTVKRDGAEIGILMYTSGSTGQPKGVMHCFENITAASVGIQMNMRNNIDANTEVRVVSYLPLSHVFERAWVECASLIDGATHIFFSESLDTFVQDLNRAKPTVFLSVPRLWLKFQHGVHAKMPAKKLERLLSIPFLGKIIGKKVLRGLGLDHVQLAGSGSAPIPADLIAWYRRLGLNLVEGYAMSEDFAYSHFSTEKFNAPGYVGIPIDGVQVRISEEGEVQIKSPGLMVGYYNRPDLTAEAFTSDGYLRTGDKGERRADGMLKLTGRLKEMFKTAKGKYVAPAPIENELNTHPMLEMSLVSGVGQPSAYAMVVLSEELRPKQKDPAFRAEVEKELSALLAEVNSRHADYEQLRMLVVAPEPWSIENGFLTPTMKIKRGRIEGAIESKVEGWYAAKGSVQWA